MTAELFDNHNQPLKVTSKKTHPVELSVGFFCQMCCIKYVFIFLHPFHW